MDSNNLRIDQSSSGYGNFENKSTNNEVQLEQFHKAHGLPGESAEKLGARISSGEKKLSEWKGGASVEDSFEGLSDVEKERLAADVLTAVSFHAIASSGEIKEGAMLDSHAFTIRDDQEILADVMDQLPTYNRASTHYKPFINSNREKLLSEFKELKTNIDQAKKELKKAKKEGNKDEVRLRSKALKDLKSKAKELKKQRKDASFGKGCDFKNSKLFSTQSQSGTVKPRTHCVFYSYADKSGKKYFAMKLEESGWKGTNMKNIDDLKTNLHHVKNFVTSRDFVSKLSKGKKGQKLDKKVTVSRRRDTDKRLQKATMKALSDAGVVKIKKRSKFGSIKAKVLKEITKKALNTKYKVKVLDSSVKSDEITKLATSGFPKDLKELSEKYLKGNTEQKKMLDEYFARLSREGGEEGDLTIGEEIFFNLGTEAA